MLLSTMRTTFLTTFIISLLLSVIADPVSLPFTDCSDIGTNQSQKLQVDTLYGQVLHNAQGYYLNLTVFGTSASEITGVINSSLATLFTTTSVLTLSAWSNSSYLCQNMRPPTPLPANVSSDGFGTYCPISSGPFAFASTIPMGSNRQLTTLITRLRAVDPLSRELLCLDTLTTPLNPQPGHPYGEANIIFWTTVGLAMGYWVLVGLTRIASAWNRGTSRSGRGIWSRIQSAGYILASAISGERFASCPALLRFCTPSMRDVIFHTQWCATLAMVALEWPQFIYPLLTQTAWATLVYNVTLTHTAEHQHWDPLNTSFSPPPAFSDQVVDPNSAIFIDRSVPNVIFTLPPHAKPGMSSFAFSLGVHPQDLFPTCLILFLGLVAGTIVISGIIWLADYAIVSALRSSGQGHGSTAHWASRARSPTSGREPGETNGNGGVEESKSMTGSVGIVGRPRFSLPLAGSGHSLDRGMIPHRAWWKLRSDIGTFHWSVLHGNLVRLLLLFHLPVTIFSCYQMTLPLASVGATSIVLAALSFTVFSILIPLHLVIRVTFTTTNKLYDQTKTLLSLGPLYNHYRHGSQLFAVLFFATNIAFGVTIGAGQKSGTAQAIVILVVEVASAFVTSIWLPWGNGASMGLISFLVCVARIIVAVLMVILSQALSVGPGPGSWVAYGILIILAMVYFAMFVMLVVKTVEGLIRLFGGIGFAKTKRTADNGILGALRVLGYCGNRRRPRRRSTRGRPALMPARMRRSASDLSSYMPPPGGIHPDGTATPPRLLTADSRKGSANSQPPSVLKPEFAIRPYKEDSSDDGYIMGAWQPFPHAPGSGYSPVTDGPQTLPPTKVASSSTPSGGGGTGFSRVGGGRAHIDSPYAIASGSTHTFPSIGQQSQIFAGGGGDQSRTALPIQPVLQVHGIERSVDDEVPLSVSNVGAVPVDVNGLPLGAMQPVHIRTKSQTAIVEDYLPNPPHSGSSLHKFGQMQASMSSMSNPMSTFRRPKYHSQDTFLKPPVTAPPTTTKFTFADDNDEDSGGEEPDQQRKRRWYQIRRSRPHSAEGRPSAASSVSELDRSGSGLQVDPELGGVDLTASSTKRSFVVIRNPPSSLGRSSQHVAASAGNTSQSTAYPKASSRPPTR